MNHVAYIGLGSNLGDRQANIEAAIEALRQDPGVLGIWTSSLHETKPVGGPEGQGLFLNGAAKVETTHTAEELFVVLQKIENDLGRKRTLHWGPRTIDLDLLLYDDRIIEEPNLTVPHPRMHERSFVLVPLALIAPDVVHPVFNKSIETLLAELPPL